MRYRTVGGILCPKTENDLINDIILMGPEYISKKFELASGTLICLVSLLKLLRSAPYAPCDQNRKFCKLNLELKTKYLPLLANQPGYDFGYMQGFKLVRSISENLQKSTLISKTCWERFNG